jgi:hypothetical protein
MCLSDKAMLVRLSISQWTGRKYDKAVSAKVASDYQTTADAGRYNKVLIAEQAIKAIAKVANDARSFHYQNTLPWNDNGDRILPAANYLTYTQKVQEFRVSFESSVNEFTSNYPLLVADAKLRLNGMFNPADYPDAGRILEKYGFDASFMPLPDAADFRVSLQQSELDAIKQDIESRTRQAAEKAMQDLWNRLHEAVSHMADKLKTSDAVFRDSLVTNLVELCELLPKLNIANDPNLEKMRQAVESKLCNVTPQQLRDNPTARKQTAKTADDILSAMAGYIG